MASVIVLEFQVADVNISEKQPNLVNRTPGMERISAVLTGRVQCMCRQAARGAKQTLLFENGPLNKI